MWFIPTLGLAITSFRDQDDADDVRLVDDLHHAGQLHPADAAELQRRVHNAPTWGRRSSTAWPSRFPATIIPILIAAFAAYAFTFMQFPGRDFLF